MDERSKEKWMRMKNPAAVSLGRITSKKKAAASRKNGKLGGRPKKSNLESQKQAIAKRLKERA